MVLGSFRGPPEAPQRLPEVLGDFRCFVDFSSTQASNVVKESRRLFFVAFGPWGPSPGPGAVVANGKKQVMGGGRGSSDHKDHRSERVDGKLGQTHTGTKQQRKSVHSRPNKCDVERCEPPNVMYSRAQRSWTQMD